VRPWHEQIAYQRTADELLPEWNRDGADFSRNIGWILGHIGYFSYPIFVGCKVEGDGSSINYTRGLTVFDQAGEILEGRFAIAVSGSGELPINGCDIPGE
jgi:hypothetical protein